MIMENAAPAVTVKTLAAVVMPVVEEITAVVAAGITTGAAAEEAITTAGIITETLKNVFKYSLSTHLRLINALVLNLDIRVFYFCLLFL